MFISQAHRVSFLCKEALSKMQTLQQGYCCVLHRGQIQNLWCVHITENLKASSGWAIQRFHFNCWMCGLLKGGEVLKLVHVTKQNAISHQKAGLISIKTSGAKSVSHSQIMHSLNNHQNRHFCLD